MNCRVFRCAATDHLREHERANRACNCFESEFYFFDPDCPKRVTSLYICTEIRIHNAPNLLPASYKLLSLSKRLAPSQEAERIL